MEFKLNVIMYVCTFEYIPVTQPINDDFTELTSIKYLNHWVISRIFLFHIMTWDPHNTS